MQTQEMNVDFQEKDLMNDLLASMKKMTADYNTFANEVAHKALKQDILDILREEHDGETMIFDQMNEHGWYQVTAASKQEIDKAKQKFSQMDQQYHL